MSHVAIVARVTVKEGRANEYVAAFVPLLEQAVKQPGTLLYAVNRSKDDPHVFWTTEVYADDAAFAAHCASEVHAAASPNGRTIAWHAGTCRRARRSGC